MHSRLFHFTKSLMPALQRPLLAEAVNHKLESGMMNQRREVVTNFSHGTCFVRPNVRLWMELVALANKYNTVPRAIRSYCDRACRETAPFLKARSLRHNIVAGPSQPLFIRSVPDWN